MIQSKVIAPSLGDKTKQCEVVRWHRDDASLVNVGDHIVTLETKKAVNEIEASITGKLRHRVTEGTLVDVGSTIAVIEHDGFSETDDGLFLTMEISHDDLSNLDNARGDLSRDKFALQSLRQKLVEGAVKQSPTCSDPISKNDSNP